MTLILAAFVTDGIVLAGDSRGTLTSDTTHLVEKVDNIHKIFLTSDNIGVAFTGSFSKEKPIAQLFEDFTSVNKSKIFNSPDELAKEILKHYVNLAEKPDIRMIIAGYDKTSNPVTQQYCQIEVSSGRGFTNKPSHSQVVIDGDGAEILMRLTAEIEIKTADGPKKIHASNWFFRSLDDAIAFTEFAGRTVTDIIRFQPRLRTVGGPMDILVIKPDAAFWYQRKYPHFHCHFVAQC